MCVRVRLLSFRLALRVWIIQSRSDIRPTSIAVNYLGTPDNMVSRWSLTGVLSFINCFIKEFVHVMHINIYWGNTLISLHYCRIPYCHYFTWFIYVTLVVPFWFTMRNKNILVPVFPLCVKVPPIVCPMFSSVSAPIEHLIYYIVLSYWILNDKDPKETV